MTKARSLYICTTKYIRDINSLYGYIQNVSPTFDTSILLRSEYVLIVSSFDKYLHDVVREKLLHNFFNRNIEFGNPLKVSIFDVMKLMDEPNQIEKELLLDGYIHQATSKSSFQSPQNVEYALSLIGLKKIWNQLASIMGQPADDIRDQLDIYVKRRNKIVHEADIDSATNTFTNIDLDTVDSCNDFMNNLVVAIEKIL